MTMAFRIRFAAELHDGRSSGDTQACFERTRFVVDAGMNNTAIVSTLVPRNVVFFFQHQQAASRETARDFQRNAESNYTTADDDYVVRRFCHERFADLRFCDLLVYDERHNRALSRIGRRARRCTRDSDLIRDRISRSAATITAARANAAARSKDDKKRNGKEYDQQPAFRTLLQRGPRP